MAMPQINPAAPETPRFGKAAQRHLAEAGVGIEAGPEFEPPAWPLDDEHAGQILDLVAASTGMTADPVEYGDPCSLVAEVERMVARSDEILPEGTEILAYVVQPADAARSAEVGRRLAASGHETDEGLVLALSNLVDRFGAAGVASTVAAGWQARPPARHPGCDSVGMIAEERHRQVVEEGHTLDHDRDLPRTTLARMAGCYIMAATAAHPEDLPVPGGWPIEPEAWKPSSHGPRNLVKAAALLAAEIDAENSRPIDYEPVR
jgi:hypothetical protein